jgi:hypothetical protein
MAPAAEPDVRAATQRRAPQAPADAPVGQPVHRFGPDRPSRPLWKPVTR